MGAGLTLAAIALMSAGGYTANTAWTQYQKSKAAADAPMPVPKADFAIGAIGEKTIPGDEKAIAARKKLLASAEAEAAKATLDETAPNRASIASIDETGHDVIGAPDGYCKTPSKWRANRIYIPSMCVRAPVLTSSAPGGSMQLPSNPGNLAWLSSSSALDAAAGTSVISGHVNYYGIKGALYDLANMRAGTTIYVTDSAGRPQKFVVNELRSYLKSGLPESLFDTNGQRRLALVTCGGTLIKTPRGNHYENNVVAYAVPMS